jgi:hypothetical protein
MDNATAEALAAEDLGQPPSAGRRVVLVRQLAQLDLPEAELAHGTAGLRDVGDAGRVEEDADVRSGHDRPAPWAAAARLPPP